MKRISYLLSMYSLAVLAVLSSCGGKDDDPVPATGPSVSAVAKTGYATGDMSVGAGESVKVAWLAKKADKDMKTFSVTTAGNNLGTYNAGKPMELTGDKKDLYEDEATIIAPENVGEVRTYTFTATDSDGKSGSFSIKLTAKSDLKETKGIVFTGDAGKVAGKGQFLISFTGKNGGSGSFSPAEAPLIDVTYQTGTGATGATFISPSLKANKGALTGLTETKYGAVTSDFYSKATSESLATAAAPTATSVTATNGGTYIFEHMVSGVPVRGLIMVTALTPGENGSVTFDVKTLSGAQ